MTNSLSQKKYPFEKIIFVYQKEKAGSTVMMAYQPFMTCQRNGIPSEVVHLRHIQRNISRIRNSVIVLIKTGTINNLTVNSLKDNNNKIIYVPADSPEQSIYSMVSGIDFDSCVLSSQIFSDKVKNVTKKSSVTVIPHHYDIFLDHEKFRQERENSLKFLFSGGKDYRGIPVNGEMGLDNVELQKEAEFFHTFWTPLKKLIEDENSMSHEEKCSYAIQCIENQSCPIFLNEINSTSNPSKFSCHYSVRTPHMEIYAPFWSNKSATKLVTAAGSDSNIITSWDPAVQELLDPSYPYAISTTGRDFIATHQAICLEMVRKVKETYRSKTWFEGLEMMRHVREKTDCMTVTRKYVDLAIQISS